MADVEQASPTICGASSRRNEGRPCRNRPLNGSTRCRMHGGSRVGKQNAARLTHGERSIYVKRELLPAVVAELAEIEAKPIQPIRVNLAERRVRRGAIEGASEEVLAVLDEADRRDVALDLKSRELEANKAAPDVVPIINFGNLTSGPVELRGEQGVIRGLPDPDNADAFLIETQPGNWQRARLIDGTWRPFLTTNESQEND